MLRRRVLAFAPLALALTACGGGSLSIDPVAAAAETTTKAAGEHVEFTIEMTVPHLDRPVTVRESGSVDNAGRKGSFLIDMSEYARLAGGRLGKPDEWRGDAVYDASGGGLVVYMRIPFLARALKADKPWVKLDFAKLGSQGGVDVSQFTQLAQGDPNQLLDFLRATSGKIEKVGSEQVGGVDTTHFRALVDLRKYPDLVPQERRVALRAQVDALVRLTGLKTWPVDVWVDGDKHVRRLAARLQEHLAGGQTFALSLRGEFSRFGLRPDIAIPSADQTTDLSQVLTKQGA